MKKNSPVIIALDFDERKSIDALVEKLNPEDCRLKIGKEAFTLFGPDVVKSLVQKDFDVFLDLKFHDIPNTVAKACKAAADLGVWMVNVHASGGIKMMQAAKDALDMRDAPLLIAVTVLTSMQDDDLKGLAIQKSCHEQALFLSSLAKQAGLDGVVCSAQEASAMKVQNGPEFQLVTPGIRPADSARDDQKRTMTPAEAIKNGSDYLVIGRPITQASDPVGKLLTINSAL